MINSLAHVSYGYTDKGNRYEKSSDGRKIGTYVGTGIAAAGTTQAIRELKKSETYKNLPRMIKDFIQNGTGVLDQVKFPRLSAILDKSKALRIGFVGLSGLTAVLLPLALFAGAGALIGNVYDKIVDASTKHKVDKAAEKA